MSILRSCPLADEVNHGVMRSCSALLDVAGACCFVKGPARLRARAPAEAVPAGRGCVIWYA